ncbi:phage tail tape measure protein [Vagococcus fluvialis]|uniref:phage tail tape measure protein n=1 Tax=Vagococcus fluvialis TaxID=2738 RepID=UPI002B2AC42B|nr:phage tail tape measure protein [Vagococcus fluvialis]
MSGGTPLGNMVIKLGLDDAEFGKGVENSKKQVRYLAKEMQANMKIADMAGNQLGKLGTRYDGLTKIIGAQEKQVQALKKAYDESFVDGKATDSTKRLAVQLQDANGKLANYKQQLINTAGAMAEYKVRNEGFTGAINKASDSLIKNGQTMENYGGKLTKGITLPLVSGAAAVTTAAISWESAFAGVKKTVDEVVDSNGRVTYSYKDLENGLRGLSKELPSSHKEIAAVAEAAGQLGIETPNVVSFTKTMIDLGESTSMSAETAATELARFANITGMSQDKFSNLGSALVDLGNNFATTEGEISAMSLRLAGAGSQIGMTEGEILGFSAALSSVGVEAEAGGSAFSKVMIQMQLATEKGMGAFDELINIGNQSGVSFDQMSYAVQKGGNTLKATAGQMGLTNKQLSSMYKEADKSAVSLQNFAEVAGMTNAEFGNMFKQDPSKAIMKFVEGLANAESQGKSAIAVLDDMDITEVRLRDSLLRAANASGVFSDAVTMGNKAFKENTALAEEASKRYETTESKLKMLKNEAVDAAIDLGGPFVDALRDGLESSKPLIKGLGDLAKKFSELEPKTQQNIVKFIGMAAAAGPLLSITGKLSTGIGGLGKAFVDLRAKSVKKKAIAEMTKQLATGAVEVGTFSTVLGGGATKLGLFGKSATVAAGTGGIAGLGTSLAALAGPATIAVASVAAVGTALYLGKKAYDNHQLAGAKWGTEVTKEQDKVIEKSLEMRDKATSYIDEYADGVRGSADKAIQANQEIVDSIQKTIEKEHDRKVKNAEQLEDGPIKDSLKQQAENDKKYGEQLAQQAQERVNKINSILSNASKNTREISDQERQYIEANYKQLSARQLELAGFTKNQITAIESAYQKDLTKLSYNELETRANNVSKALNNEQESYKKSRQAILDGTKDGTQRQISLLKELDTEHKNSTESMVLGLAKLRLQQGLSVDSMAAVWEQYGWTVEEVERLVAKSSESSSKNLDMFAKGMNEADIRWNELAFDPKTGEVKTNMADTLVEIAKTEDGWNQLEFMAKNANLTTNAKEEIAVAMGEVDKWQFLSVEDKRLLLNNDEAKIKLFDTINELGMWNTFNADRKLLGVENADAIYKMMDSADKLNQWNTLPPDLKTLIADNPAKLTVEQTKQALDIYNALPEDLKTLLANNTNAVNNVGAAQRKIIEYNEQKIGDKHLHATANYGEVEAAKNAIAQVYSKNVVIDVEYRGRRTGHTAIPTFRGTNHHPGGDMIVNDQKGSLYEEIVKFPGKAAFIPKGRDVYIPNAPIGTKVIKASDTKRIMNRMGVPRYAQGVGVPKNSTLVKDLESVNSRSSDNVIKVNNNDLSSSFNALKQTVSEQGKLAIEILRVIAAKELIVEGSDIHKLLSKYQSNDLTKLKYGKGY